MVYLLRDARAKTGTSPIRIITQSDAAKGFELLPRRWVVEQQGKQPKVSGPESDTQANPLSSP